MSVRPPSALPIPGSMAAASQMLLRPAQQASQFPQEEVALHAQAYHLQPVHRSVLTGISTPVQIPVQTVPQATEQIVSDALHQHVAVAPTAQVQYSQTIPFRVFRQLVQ